MKITEYLKNNRLITDGAFGTYYQKKFKDEYNVVEKANTKAPDRVKKIHLEYIEAGAYLDDRAGDEIRLILLRCLSDDVGQGVDGPEKVSARFVAKHRIVDIAAVKAACLAHDGAASGVGVLGVRACFAVEIKRLFP